MSVISTLPVKDVRLGPRTDAGKVDADRYVAKYEGWHFVGAIEPQVLSNGSEVSHVRGESVKVGE